MFRICLSVCLLVQSCKSCWAIWIRFRLKIDKILGIIITVCEKLLSSLQTRFLIRKCFSGRKALSKIFCFGRTRPVDHPTNWWEKKSKNIHFSNGGFKGGCLLFLLIQIAGVCDIWQEGHLRAARNEILSGPRSVFTQIRQTNDSREIQFCSVNRVKTLLIGLQIFSIRKFFRFAEDIFGLHQTQFHFNLRS